MHVRPAVVILSAMGMTVSQLAGRIGATVRGDGSRTLSACAGLETAGADQVSFVANARYVKRLADTAAGAVIVTAADAEQAPPGLTLLVADDPYFAFRQAVVALHGYRKHPEPGVSDKAVVDPAAALGRDCHVGPFVCIEAGARLGDRCVIYPHCWIGPNARLGDDCVLFPNVTVYDDCVLGDRVTLHAGCVIGQDGFGYATHKGEHHKIPQVGNAVVEDDVEMGANCAIDRATVGSTRIGKGTKFSDLVAIGHGTQVGRHNLLVAQVGIAGSVQTGDYVVMGGQVGVAGHLKIAAGVQLAGKTAVISNIDEKGPYGGIPALPLNIAKRNALFAMQIPKVVEEVRRMRKRLGELEQRLGLPDEQKAEK